jgi:hypothetical protein
MRTNLILNFRCERCGNLLDLEYGEPLSFPLLPGQEQSPPVPTGAACVNSPVVLVKPCRGCVEPIREHVRNIARSFRALEKT